MWKHFCYNAKSAIILCCYSQFALFEPLARSRIRLVKNNKFFNFV